jgi:WD40 repeat protein
MDRDQTTRHIQLSIATAEIYACAFAPDGARALVGAQGNPVGLWDVTRGILLREYEHSGPVWSVVWSNDQRRFLSLDGRMRVWDVETGECVHTVGKRHARCLAVSADATTALTAADRILQVTDLQSRRHVRALNGHTDGIYCAAFDGMSERALSGARDQTVRVWDLQTGRCARVLDGHDYHVHGVAWLPDQQHAISCSTDIRLWDVDRGECVRVFHGHTDTIRSVTVSADGRRALSASHDRTVRLWDLQTGNCVRVLEGHTDGVVVAAYSADEQSVLSCDWGGGVRVWDVR